MKRLIINPQIKSSRSGYRDRDYEYPQYKSSELSVENFCIVDIDINA